ncbi:MAG TPA: class I SAM-dependent methyltransferase [Bacteroidota bacterium]|nr:class I SAM-dependent methyltransferase [Bacteroidota bacterium]
MQSIIDQSNVEIQIAPEDGQKSLVQSFFDESKSWQGNIYENMDDRFNRTMMRRKRYVLDMMDSVPRGEFRSVLDVGCGCGEYSAELMAMGLDVHGIDLSPAMIETSKHRLRKFAADSARRFHRGDVENIPFPDDSFDAVVCVGVFGYLLSDDRGVDEIMRVLRPNGWLVLSVQNAISLSNLDFFLRKKLQSMVRGSNSGNGKNILQQRSWSIPSTTGDSLARFNYKSYNPWLLENFLERKGFVLHSRRTFGYEFRVVRRYRLLPESLLTKIELFLETLFSRTEIPYFSCSGESYIGVFQKK